MSLEPLLKIFNREPKDLIPGRFRDAMKACGDFSEPQWQYILPTELYRKNVKQLIEELKSALTSIDKDYSAFFYESNKILFSLEQCSIDRRQAKRILQNGDVSSLASFLCDGLPVYSRANTRTGRLTIKSGPKILTLPREMKKLLRASSSSSSLYEIDFVSLEPRVARYLVNPIFETLDIYMKMIEDLNLSIDRDTAKLATLCVLYGAGIHKLREVTGSHQRASVIKKKVESYFGVKGLGSELRQRFKADSLTNFFGRPLAPDSDRKSLLINNFIQSTAADIALYGFSKLCDNLNSAKPVFVIHDALLIEVPKTQDDVFRKCINNGIVVPNLGTFPLSIKELNNE